MDATKEIEKMMRTKGIKNLYIQHLLLKAGVDSGRQKGKLYSRCCFGEGTCWGIILDNWITSGSSITSPIPMNCIPNGAPIARRLINSDKPMENTSITSCNSSKVVFLWVQMDAIG
jgi:hypothetical protein